MCKKPKIQYLVFVDSPIQEGPSGSEPCEERQTWFTTTDDNFYKRDYPTNNYNGTFERSSQFVRTFINDNVCSNLLNLIIPLTLGAIRRYSSF